MLLRVGVTRSLAWQRVGIPGSANASPQGPRGFVPTLPGPCKQTCLGNNTIFIIWRNCSYKICLRLQRSHQIKWPLWGHLTQIVQNIWAVVSDDTKFIGEFSCKFLRIAWDWMATYLAPPALAPNV